MSSESDWEFNDLASDGVDQDGVPFGQRNQTSAPTEGYSAADMMNDAAELSAIRKDLKEQGIALAATLRDPNTRMSERQDAATKLLTAILPVLLNQMTSLRPNGDISLAVSRTTALLKELSNQFEKAEKHKQDMTINPHSEKFRQAFAMFFDDVMRSLKDSNIPDGQQETFKAALADRLRGYEERVDELNTETMSARTRRNMSIDPDAAALVDVSNNPRPNNRMN